MTSRGTATLKDPNVSIGMCFFCQSKIVQHSDRFCVDSTQTYIQRLPNETLDRIFQCVRWTQTYPHDAKQAMYFSMRVCKLWYHLCRPYLWRTIRLESPHIREYFFQYCNRLFTTLNLVPESWSNLQYVRRLTLYLHNNDEPVSSISQCEAILHRIGRLRYVFHYATAVDDIEVRFDPFIPTDCENEEFWPLLERANQIMQDLALSISQRPGLKKTEIKTGRQLYCYEERSRAEVDTLLGVLGSSMSHLSLADSSLLAVNEWLSRIDSFSVLKLTLHPNDTEERTVAMDQFWRHVNRLRLTGLSIDGGFPIPCLYDSLLHLQTIAITGVESGLDAAQLFYACLPRLSVCAINVTGDRFMDDKDIPVFKGSVLSKCIKTLTFINSIAPLELIQEVASSSTTHIDIVNLPRNATDLDFQVITSHCPNLRVLSIEYGTAVTSLALLQKLTKLESFRIGWCHLQYLNQTLLYTIAQKCHCLEKIAVAKDNEHRHLEDLPLRQAFQQHFQEKSFGVWLNGVVGIVNNFCHRLEIHLEAIRRTEGFKSFCEAIEKSDYKNSTKYVLPFSKENLN
jgi:hypothetical protein